MILTPYHKCYSVLLLACLFGVWAPALGDTGQLQNEPHPAHAEPTKVSPDASPKSVVDIFAAVHAKLQELAKTVADKKLDDVHHLAFAIRDLTIPLAQQVPAEKKSRIQGTLNNIAKLAEQLDSTGDAGDQSGTEANLKRMDGVIKMLETQVRGK